MQKNKINILCTRPLEDSLIKEADAAGIAIEILPFIKTRKTENKIIQEEINKLAEHPATVIFTSMNAVESVIPELKGLVPKWNIYCTGTATADLVVQYFGEASIKGKASDAEELADLIAQKKNIDQVIFFCGNIRRDELPDKLHQNNIKVHELVVYETMLIEHKIDKSYQGILFFSPSAVTSFFNCNKLNDEPVLFAIGKTTANEIKKHTGNKIVISDIPGKENLLKKMIEHFSIIV